MSKQKGGEKRVFAWCGYCFKSRRIVEEREKTFLLECGHEVYNGR